MNEPLLFLEKLDGGDSCRGCGAPAPFQITVGLVNEENKLCGQCAVAFVLQTFRLEGVALEEIREVFPKLSAAIDAPLASSAVQ